MPKTVYFVSSKMLYKEFYKEYFSRLNDVLLVTDRTCKKARHFAQLASHDGAQIILAKIPRTDPLAHALQNASFATKLFNALSERQCESFDAIQCTIMDSHQESVVIVGRMSSLKVLATHFISEDSKSMHKIPSYCQTFVIDTLSMQCTIVY